MIENTIEIDISKCKPGACATDTSTTDRVYTAGLMAIKPVKYDRGLAVPKVHSKPVIDTI